MIPFRRPFSLVLLLPFVASAEPDPRTAPLAAEDPLYLDTSASIDARVTDLMSRLSLEEKATILNHDHPDIERIGLRGDKWNQCLNGVQWNRPTTLFPICPALAASWDPEFVRDEVVRVISDEARAIYNGWRRDPSVDSQHKGLIYRDPVINIGRNPYWGRNYEIWGEDPFLTGRMGVAYTEGLHGDDPAHLKIASTLKHYAVNNVEARRFELSAEVSERMLHEYWLPQFRDAVVEAGATSLMASYNAINGTPNNINHYLLTEVLKERWDHEGFVVSDLGGVRTMVEGHEDRQMAYIDAVARSVMAGCDFSDDEYQEHIPEAVRTGKLSRERLDDALARVLRVRFRLGAFDPLEHSPYSGLKPEIIDSEPHHRVALEAARRSMTLLQNRDGMLPLDRDAVEKVALIGPFADHVFTHWYTGRHEGVVTALKGIRDYLGDDVEVVYARGARADSGSRTQTDREDGMSGGASLKLNATSVGEYVEFSIMVPQAGSYEMELQYKGFPTRGVYQAEVNGTDTGYPVDMYRGAGAYGRTAHLGTAELERGNNAVRFRVIDRSDASDGFTGHFDKLTLNGPEAIDYELEATDFETGTDGPGGALEEALAAAEDADAVIPCLGSDSRNEREELDRTFLGLPGDQQALADAVLAEHPRSVALLFAAGPLTVPEIKENAAAMLQVWWPGQRGGTAIAETLFGDVNPGGHLPYTVYASESQVPPIDEYEINEGFTYMYLKGEPLFAFGHGLSYTEFAYDDLRLDVDRPDKGGAITARIDVTNTGDRAGDDVVQLYARAIDPQVFRPGHELRGFRRISLDPGETRTVTIEVPVDELAYYDEDAHAFAVDAGEYEIQIGAASDDVRQRGRITIPAGFSASP